jgi:hypothetical protein
MRFHLGWLGRAVFFVAMMRPVSAWACGGGLVSVGTGNLGADRQRIFLSVRGATTEVITEVSVPATTADYGVLLPVPAAPTLDPQPVAAADLDTLDRVTAPQVFATSSSDSGGGCGCPLGAGGGSNATNGGTDRGVDASAPIDIGPVTAVVLTADTGDAVNAWLAANGFALPPDGPALVDAYAGTGRFFVAIRRNDSAAPGGVTSVGVHFSLPGDARALPLRFAHLGAAATVSFTVFVAAPTAVAPALPFEALTLSDLNASLLRAPGYAAALAAAVAARNHEAFIIEGVFPGNSWTGLLPAVTALIDPAASVTRLSTILPAAALTTDVALDQRFMGQAPTSRYVEAERPVHSRLPPGGVAGLTFLLACALVGKRRGR